MRSVFDNVFRVSGGESVWANVFILSDYTKTQQLYGTSAVYQLLCGTSAKRQALTGTSELAQALKGNTP
jgi:hypothetical protein